ncbi:glycoside hydrolase [Salegentibacter salinarum]|uniref:Glycoside hydrolase n=1 Tax=Salegentibacter salinarum TaxID=447422 RepID=A0A2N0TNX0_9FLAO|nr:glycoside hydrolase 43 family protein [Salegentibacter salinarum]PKD16430.1 glycoside hydrolase [Salegentibacter salinarum]SKB64175.1 Beta-xylosidase [Salegentibacter salinarum]
MIKLKPYKLSLLICGFIITGISSLCAQNDEVSEVWVSDQGDGTFKNPVLHADYSDPDVVRVGDDYYMTASSFNVAPGLPVLHSKDLVNWELIGHALERQVPTEHFKTPQHGNGVWAPAFRYHNDEFYIYWGDPDFGIYMVKSKNPEGPWEEPVLVEEGKGLIDPAPLWDDDGKAYLVHAYAGSRAGIKSILVVKPMNEEGTKTTGQGRIVFDGHENHPTVEGSKFYKKDGLYYIFAPAGGVSTGWQLILRSENVYGPYEEHISLAQGETDINGPHQGAWVDTESGEDWFIHFQDKGAYGRIVHLQPMEWNDGWPTMGEDPDGDGTGQPVMSHKKPDTGEHPIKTPADSDEFGGDELGLQWQWHANPKATWSFLNPSKEQLRLYTQQIPDDSENLWEAPNLLLQKFPAEEFTTTTKLTFNPNEDLENEKAGLVVMGMKYAYIAVKSKEDGLYLVYSFNEDAENGAEEKEEIITKLTDNTVHLRVKVDKDAQCTFSYSENGRSFKEINDEAFKSVEGKWIGAKVGIFALKEDKINDSGYADFDWFRFSK